MSVRTDEVKCMPVNQEEAHEAVKRYDDKNSIAVHACTHRHQIAWDGVKLWKKKYLEEESARSN